MPWGNKFPDMKNDPSYLEGRLSNAESSLAQKAMQHGIDVTQAPYNVKGDGSDATQALLAAMSYCESNSVNLYIPRGSYLITQQLPYPNKYTVFGDGYNTNLILNLPAGSYCFKEAVNWRYSAGIQGLRFTIANGASNDVGAIYTEYLMRGGFIRDIWAYELNTPIYLGDSIWGLVEVDNIYLYRLNQFATSKTAMYIKGNTVMMSNIEITGGWDTGLALDGAGVFKLHGFNIAGSSIQMRKAIEISNSSGNGSISGGWIEQLDATYWANGDAHAIYVKDSSAIDIKDVLCASGSIYSDNSKINVSGVTFSQSNGGFKYLNNGQIITDTTCLKTLNVGSNPTNSDGEVILIDKRTHPNGLVYNPIMKNGISHPLNVTNGGIVTLVDDTTASDFISSDRAIKATVTANFHGVYVSAPAIVGKMYTAVFKVKPVSGVLNLQTNMQAGGSTVNNYPCSMQRTGASGYYTLYHVFTATATTISAKVQAVIDTTGGNTQAVFLVDSADIFPGFNPFDPSNYEEDTLSNQGRFKNSAVPFKSKWLQGWKVKNSAISAGGYEYNICTITGTAESNAWIASHAYTVGFTVNANGNVYKCATAGTSGSTAPSGTGTGITDGTCTWDYVDVFAVFKGVGLVQT